MLTHTIEFIFDDITWCVRKSDLRSPWISVIVTIASPTVWAIFVLSVYLFAFSFFLMLKHYHHPENFHYCVGMSFFTVIGAPLPYNPTRGSARLHFGMYLTYGLIAAIFINCHMISSLTKSSYNYQITKPKELLHHKYEILIDSESTDLSDLGNDEVIQFFMLIVDELFLLYVYV